MSGDATRDLSADEQSLLDACLRGERWTGTGKAVRASVLRGILLGLFGYRPANINIRGGEVIGALKLSDLPIGHDRRIPSLRLREMQIDDPIYLDNCRIARLALNRCRITRLQARDAEFAGAIDLRGLRASGHRLSPGVVRYVDRDVDAPECSVDLANSRIDGDVRLNDAQLCVGKPYSDEQSIGPKPYALNLRAAEVAGALRMEPNFVAVGGVTIADAHIRGDVRAHGALLTARYGAAFRGQNARIGGTLFCRSLARTPANGVRSETIQIVSRDEGGVIFQNAEIGRVELDGCSISWAAGDPAASRQPAVDMSYARISGAITGEPVALTAGPAPALFVGQVALIGARIGGDVVLNSARIDDRALPGDGPTARYALALRAATVGGSIRLSRGFEALGGVSVADAVISGDIYVSDATLTAPPGGDALRGRNTQIAGVLRGGCGRYAGDHFKPLTTEGGVAFPNASMDLVDLSGAEVRSTGEPGSATRRGRVDFESAHVRAGFFLCSAPGDIRGVAPANADPRVEGPVILTDARIDGDLDLHGLTIRPEARTALTASGLVVAGSVAMADRSPTGGRERDAPSPFTIESSPDTDPLTPSIDLTGVRIGQNFWLNTTTVHRLNAPNLQVRGDAELESDAASEGELVTDLRGAVVTGRLALTGIRLRTARAQGLKVDGDLRLIRVRIGGPCQFDRSQVGGHVDIDGVEILPDPGPDGPDIGKVEGSNRLDLPSVYFDGSQVRGALRVRDLLAPADARVAREESVRRWREALDASSAVSPGQDDGAEKVIIATPHASLLFVRAGQLDDLAASGWGQGLCMRLKGFTYEAIYFNERDHALKPRTDRHTGRTRDPTPADPAILLAPWLGAVAILLGGGGLLLQLIAPLHRLAATLPGPGELLGRQWAPSLLSAVALLLIWLAYILIVLNPSPRSGRVTGRLAWLRSQFATGEADLHRDYHPQPYIQLARTYRLQGLFEFSDAVLDHRVGCEVAVKRQRLNAGLSRSSHILRRAQARLLGAIWTGSAAVYRTLFGYGLKPHLAVVTFVLCWLSGAAVVDGLATLGLFGASSPCIQSISKLVYALDVFVPLLDLGVADLCRVPMHGPAGAAWWVDAAYTLGHVAMAGFAVVGWIVTSLTILTLTGVLRRLAES